MIQRNLGNLERLVRLALGLGLLVWAFIRPELNLTEMFVVAVAVMLILNGIFSRCYVWYVLNLDTSGADKTECRPL